MYDRLVARVPNAAALKASILAHQTSAEEAGRVAQQAGVRTLVLSHFVPPDAPDVTDTMWRDAASRHFRGTVIVGRDLLRSEKRAGGGEEVAGTRRTMRHRAIARDLVIILAASAAVAVFAGPPLPQPASYHMMADQRTWLGIPNALNVLSNLPFAIVGLLGLQAIFTSDVQRRAAFDDSWERWPNAALFTGVALTTFGSGYYHLAPDNLRLVWDRLPMTLGFMGLLTAVLADRGHPALARRLFVPLLAGGVASVVYWYWSEVRGAGDLRPYLLVQFGSLLAVLLLMAFYPARSGGSGYLLAALIGYGVAKAFETADAAIFGIGEFVSGHTLKHLAAAAGVGCLVGMLRSRRASYRRAQELS